MALIDSHQHFWKLDNPGHQWPDATWPRLHRDFLPADLHGATRRIDLDGTVLVQSQPDDRDTDWLLTLAACDDRVLAVVGWVDLLDAQAPQRIATLARHPKLRGLRPMLEQIEDSEWLLRPAIAPAIEAMITCGLRLDALVQPRHLPALAQFAARWPDLPIVIDHGAKPDVAALALAPWRDDIAELGARPHVCCKLSGLRTMQALGQSAEDLRPYVEHLMAIFGPRLMWGSDWPVLLNTGDAYGDWLANAMSLTAPADDDARAMLFHGAAKRFYGIDL